MKIADIKKRAADMGLTLQAQKKADLIRAIQKAEGNDQCFSSGRNSCDQISCCWRDDCLPKGKKLAL
jgi:hypothetical protein